MHVVFNILTLTFLMCPVSVRHHIVRDELQIQVSPPQSMRAVDRCTIICPAMRARRWTSGTSWRGLQRSPEVTLGQPSPSLRLRTALSLQWMILWEQLSFLLCSFCCNSCNFTFCTPKKIIIAMISYIYLMFVQYNQLKYSVCRVDHFSFSVSSGLLFIVFTGIWTKSNHPSSLSAIPNNITLR